MAAPAHSGVTRQAGKMTILPRLKGAGVQSGEPGRRPFHCPILAIAAIVHVERERTVSPKEFRFHQTDPATGKRHVQIVGADAGARLKEAVAAAAKR